LPTTADFQKLVTTCLLAVSCDPFYFETTISQCITEDYLDAALAFSCLRNITSCADYTACRGNATASLQDCPNSATAAHCDARGRAVNCNGQADGFVLNCAQQGGTCATHLDSLGSTVAECVVVPTCTETDAMEHCQGGNLYTCIGGVGYGHACGANATCATVAGSVGCYFNEPACTTTGYSCNGNNVVWCTSGNQTFTFNCSRGGLTCALDNTGNGGCVAPGCSLSTPCTESCGSDGHTLTLCIGNAPYKVDCATKGFAGCAKTTDSTQTPPQDYAYCQ
jgi:hypothetical protein